MAGTIQADYLQPSSSAGLTIQTPSGNNILSMNSAGIFSSGGSLFLAANGQIVSFNTNYPGYISANNGVYSANNYTGPFTNGIVMDYASSNGRFSVGNSSGYKFYNGGVGGTQLMTITSSGDVGIGTGSPVSVASHKVFVLSGSSTDGAQIRLQNGTTGSSSSDGALLALTAGATPDVYLWNYESAATIFGTNNTERARIDSSGNFILTAAGNINLNTLNTYSNAAGSGYQKFPSGIIIQWGTTAFNSSGVASITFPVAFPNAFRFINASVWRGVTLGGYLMSTQIGATSTTGATIIGNFTTTGTVYNLSGNEAAAWLAVGY